MNPLIILGKVFLQGIFSQIFAAFQNVSSVLYYCKKLFGYSGIQILTDKPITSRKIAIFASFESKPNGLLEAQLSELFAAGFECVFVSNAKVSTEFSSWLLTRVSVLITRPNIARDFGAYKCGYLYLYTNKAITKCDELLFVNDTIFFPLFETSQFWHQINNMSEDVVGAFESFSPRHHIQSFFILCKNEVHSRSFFYSFWKNYSEWNSRRHAISKGEVAFTSMLKKGGAKTVALINQKACVNLKTLEENEDRGTISDTRNVEEKNADLIWSIRPKIPRHIKLLLLFKELERSNPSHNLGLFSVLRMGLPLMKKDLVFRGSVTLGEIALLHKEAKVTLPLDDMLRLLKAKGLPAERTVWDKLRSWSGAS